jgi:actin-related protein
MTYYLRDLIDKRDPTFFPEFAGSQWFNNPEVPRDIKEKACFVSLNPFEEDFSRDYFYTLPDNSKLKMSSEVFQVPEILFKPHLIGSQEMDLISGLKLSMNQVSENVNLLGNIVMGGSSIFPGLNKRINKEINGYTKSSPSSKFAMLHGSLIYSNTEIMNKCWITKEIFHEIGSHSCVAKSKKNWTNLKNKKFEMKMEKILKSLMDISFSFN